MSNSFIYYVLPSLFRCSDVSAPFHCASNASLCLVSRSVCDGVADCPDGSDETADHCHPQ